MVNNRKERRKMLRNDKKLQKRVIKSIRKQNTTHGVKAMQEIHGSAINFVNREDRAVKRIIKEQEAKGWQKRRLRLVRKLKAKVRKILQKLCR